MNRNKYIKTFWNERFFDLPEKTLKSKITALKLGYIKNKINLVKPILFVCNKTSPFDRKLITNTMNGSFVFLKDWVIQEIYNGNFSEENKKELYKSFKTLKEAYISVVVFPEKNLTVFGKPSHLPLEITNFLNETDYDIKFLNLVGSYFAKPIWSPIVRRCETRFHHQFSIGKLERSDLSNNDINEYMNSYMPSSASVYTYKFDPEIRSNDKAHNLETIVYCCPSCKKFFTLYSEFNCLKCKECGSAIECSSSGRISLSSKISTFDDLSEFQFNTLKDIYFDDRKPMISYENVSVYTLPKNSQLVIDIGNLKVDIFCNKIVINTEAKKVSYKLIDVKEVEYKPDNMLYVTMNNSERFILHGNDKENFYIIHDLLEVMKQIKN